MFLREAQKTGEQFWTPQARSAEAPLDGQKHAKACF